MHTLSCLVFSAVHYFALRARGTNKGYGASTNMTLTEDNIYYCLLFKNFRIKSFTQYLMI
jgi:hypothetical protein